VKTFLDPFDQLMAY